MAVVNINREVTDQFYRYKMPKLLAKVEGKGNGIKTVIVNMPEVAKALHRPPEYPCKFFGCELGAQTQFDYKNDRYIVNGSHDCNRLQELLDGFIKKFVLCQECDNPETNLAVLNKKGMIVQRCIACGHQGDVDMRHKLTTYILKNPPNMDQTLSTQGTTPSKDKKGGKKGGKKGKEDRNSTGNSPEAGSGDVTTNGKHSPTVDEPDSDDDWGEDISEAAVQARMEEISGAAKAMTLSDDVEKTSSERVNIFFEYVKKRKDSGTIVGPEHEKEVVGEADRLDVREKAPMVLVELLHDQNILSQIKTYRNLFVRFTYENDKAQKYLLGGFEQLVVVHKDTLIPKVPLILKAYYDLDILDEEVLLDWHQKASKKYVSKEMSREIHQKAEPFLNWLKEADEESSGEEEEEDVEVVYTNTEKVGIKTVEKPKVNNNDTKVDDEEEDDLDIDDI